MAYVDNTILKSTLTKIKTWAEGLFVAKEVGKGLSTNDYTNAEKQKLAGLEAPKIQIVKVNGSPLSPDGSKSVNIDLSPYALSEAVTAEIAEAVSGITGFDAQVVEELPQTGTKGILYLVANSGSGQNIYSEYVWINGKYEKLGDREIDLSGYALKTEIPTNVSDLTNDSNFQTNTQVSSAIAQAIADANIPTKVSELVNDSGFQTSAQVTQAISTATANMVETDDLASYALKSELPVAMQQNELEQIWTEVMGA